MDCFDLFNVNVGIVKNLVQQIVKICLKVCVGIIINLVNIIVVIVVEVLKKVGVYDKNKLFGVIMLDIICFNIFVVELKGKLLMEVEVLVIGGYFGVMILLLLLQISGVSFIE